MPGKYVIDARGSRLEAASFNINAEGNTFVSVGEKQDDPEAFVEATNQNVILHGRQLGIIANEPGYSIGDFTSLSPGKNVLRLIPGYYILKKLGTKDRLFSFKGDRSCNFELLKTKSTEPVVLDCMNPDIFERVLKTIEIPAGRGWSTHTSGYCSRGDAVPISGGIMQRSRYVREAGRKQSNDLSSWEFELEKTVRAKKSATAWLLCFRPQPIEKPKASRPNNCVDWDGVNCRKFSYTLYKLDVFEGNRGLVSDKSTQLPAGKELAIKIALGFVRKGPADNCDIAISVNGASKNRVYDCGKGRCENVEFKVTEELSQKVPSDGIVEWSIGIDSCGKIWDARGEVSLLTR
jgi:hypothetical protein